MEKRLFRNEHNKAIAGVASGVAEYLQADVNVVRVLFVLSTIFLAGLGLLTYIVLWIVIPVNNDPVKRYNEFNDYFQKNQHNSSMFNSPNAFNNPSNAGQQTKWNTQNVGADFQPNDPSNFEQLKKDNDTSRTIGGLIILILGIYFLFRQLDLIPQWFNIFKIYKLWPVAIIAVGISLIFRNQRKTEWDNFKKTTAEAQKTSTEQPVEEATIVEEDKNSTTTNP